MRRHLLRIALFLLIGFPAAAPAVVPEAAPFSATAVRARGPIAIDGRLNEEAWVLAPSVAEFAQRDPDEGRPATERTEIRLVYDDEALYLGARLFDSQPSDIVRRLTRRDATAASDYLRLYLDPHHDHKSGVMFVVSAAGSQADALISNDYERDLSWDGVWESNVGADAEGWTVEMRIPFSQLRFPPGAHQTWGLNVSRYIHRNNEDDWWVLVRKDDSRLVSAFGHLEGLDGVRPRRNLELLPYVTSSAERLGTAQVGGPFGGPNRLLGGAGLDLKWGLTSSFTLDAAVNPDFGQVEVDPAVVNLTAFETFYQEKRRFFIEGAQQFGTFGRNGLVLYGRFGARYPSLWYSRRIGRAPHLDPDGDFVSQPSATTILGAAKVTGRTAGGWNLSFIDAVTDREWAKVATGDSRSTTEVEPATNYMAARVTRDLGGRGAVGLLATSVNRRLSTGGLRQEVGHGAYAGGFDANLFLDAKKLWVLSGSVAASHVAGDPAVIGTLQRSSARYYQRPDAPHLRLDPSSRSLSGWTGQVNLNRTRGSMLLDVAAWAISPGFESNDLGFSPAADRAGAHVGWIWQKTTPDRWTRDRSLVLIGRWLWNTAGDRLIDGYSAQLGATLHNYWYVGANADLDRPHFDDRETRGGPLMRRPSSWSSEVYLSSDGRKKLSFNASASHARNRAGGWTFQAGPSVVFRPSPSLSLTVGPDLTRARAVAQYVTAVTDASATATFGRRAIFSDLDRTEVSMVTRLNVIFTPKASLEIYAQPLVSSGRYWGLKEFARPRAFDFLRYGTDAGTIAYDRALQVYSIDPDGSGPASVFRVDEPNFNYRSLRINAVFRWEWRLGSTLYAVWTQQREESVASGEFGLGRDLRSMARAPGDNVLMVKLAYWLGR